MKKMTLNNVYEWPLMTRLLLLGLIFAATFYLGYRFDISKQMLKLTRAEQQETDLRQQLEFTIRKNKMTQADIAQLPALTAKLQAWKKQLITYNDLPELLNQILKLGGDNHLFFSLFTPGENVMVAPVTEVSGNAQAGAATPAASAAPATSPAPTDNNQDSARAGKTKVQFGKVPIKAVVIGNYHQISEFISQMANLSWVVVIGNFTITNENEPTLIGEKMAKQVQAQHLLTAELAIDVYYLPESK
jgi:Tfp pilus assembly protein PilO